MEINKKLSKKKIIIITAVVAAIVITGAIAAYAMYKQAPPSIDSKKIYNPTTMNSDSNVPKPDNTKSNGGVTQSKDNPTTPPAPSSDVKPSTPIGTFVSSHHVSLSGINTEESTCSTTPGAQCQIAFAMSDGTQKTLPGKATDSNGNVSWTWNPKDLGLTAGEWTVTATATIASNTAFANDAMKLEISQ